VALSVVKIKTELVLHVRLVFVILSSFFHSGSVSDHVLCVAQEIPEFFFPCQVIHDSCHDTD
jgi:hypothetical protein